MIEFVRKGKEWKVVEFLHLPEAPQGIVQTPDKDFLIETSNMLLRVNLKKEVSILVINGRWGGLYPHSITVDEDFAYIGMRQFVARCKLVDGGQNFKFLLPDKTWLNTKTE